MATPKKTADRNAARAQEFQKLFNLYKSQDYDARLTSGNTFMYPFVMNGEEFYAEIKLSIPTGSREDGKGYDGYEAATNYEIIQKENALKAKKRADEKKRVAEEKERRRADVATRKAAEAAKRQEIKEELLKYSEKDNLKTE